MVGCSIDNDSMDNSMVGRTGRMDKMELMGIVDVDVDAFFCDVSHNCHNRIHNHHRICHIDRNQTVLLFFLLLISI